MVRLDADCVARFRADRGAPSADRHVVRQWGAAGRGRLIHSVNGSDVRSVDALPDPSAFGQLLFVTSQIYLFPSVRSATRATGRLVAVPEQEHH